MVRAKEAGQATQRRLPEMAGSKLSVNGLACQALMILRLYFGDLA